MSESSSETPTKFNTHSLTFPASNLDAKSSKPAVTPEPSNIIGVVMPRSPAKVYATPTATQPSQTLVCTNSCHNFKILSRRKKLFLVLKIISKKRW
jgi:hypothetical protein